MSGSAVEESTGKRKAGRPPKQGSVAALARRAALASQDADMSHLEKNPKIQAAARKGNEARGFSVKPPQELPANASRAMALKAGVHPSEAKALMRRALTQHEKNANEGRLTISSAIPLAAQFLKNLVAGKIEGASVGDRVQGAKIILTAAKIIGESSQKQRDGNDPADMSADELRAFIRSGMEQLAAMEREPIDVTPAEDRTANPGSVPDDSGS